MAELTRSVPDIAEDLMREFENVIPMSKVTAVVMRLSRDTQVTLSSLAERARRELHALAAAVPSTGGS